MVQRFLHVLASSHTSAHSLCEVSSLSVCYNIRMHCVWWHGDIRVHADERLTSYGVVASVEAGRNGGRSAHAIRGVTKRVPWSYPVMSASLYVLASSRSSAQTRYDMKGHDHGAILVTWPVACASLSLYLPVSPDSMRCLLFISMHPGLSYHRTQCIPMSQQICRLVTSHDTY